MMIRKVRKLQNQSYLIAVPTKIRKYLNLTEEDNVEYKLVNGVVTIQKARKEVTK